MGRFFLDYNTYKQMIFRCLLYSLLVAFSLGANAQSELTLKNNMMFTDVIISHNGTSHKAQTLIDTGASVCIIDSTYAVDSCNIVLPKRNAAIESASGKTIDSFSFDLDSISLCGTHYDKIRCYVVDLVGKLKHYAPKFILGGDILKRNLWCFDLKDKKITKLENPELKNIQSTIKWKNHDDYKDAFLNSIYFDGKIAGKKARILFDSGSRRNFIPQKFKISPTKIIDMEQADIAQTMNIQKTEVCENVNMVISNNCYTLDFVLSDDKYPTINSEFLLNKTFALDYKNKCIYIWE